MINCNDFFSSSVLLFKLSKEKNHDWFYISDEMSDKQQQIETLNSEVRVIRVQD
jgi:hypothetical protein